MSRDQRVEDNHALLAAQEIALERKLPLVVAFNLLPSTGYRAREHYEFMVQGLKEVEKSLRKYSVPFIMMSGNPKDSLPKLFSELNPTHILFDFNPLRGVRAMQKGIAKNAHCMVGVVDAHNIIPAWIVSSKEEYAAHTMRNKIHKQLEKWLTAPGVPQRHPYKLDEMPSSMSWREVDALTKRGNTCGIQHTFSSGEASAKKQVDSFIHSGIAHYALERNDPNTSRQSDLSPYLHFGQLYSGRVALDLLDKQASDAPLLYKEARLVQIGETASTMDNINAFLEELIVRKELSDNFCFYNPHYDSLKGAKDWAQKTLDTHRDDKREYLYMQDEWETAETHDEAWNAAQNELARTGKLHGYMRMYWAKKILEWSETPEVAIKIAIYLNDRYSLDGGDPNGYTGIMWSIAGIHDRPWFERPVYGKIRYMNAPGLNRKFNLKEYLNRYSA